MQTFQKGILQDIPSQGLYVSYQLAELSAVPAALRVLRDSADGENCVLGIGESLVSALGRSVPGLRVGFHIANAQVALPQQAIALWLWLRGDDRGSLLLAERQWTQRLQPAFQRLHRIEAFRFADGRDLTGYRDGTENPEGKAALDAAFIQADEPSIVGSSFAAIQQWQHQFDRFESLSSAAQDHAIGRRRSDDEELEDASESAHVKRTAQEDFSPEAFLLRRSMPWSAGSQAGLMFVAFGHSFDAFEAQLTRMSGAEDGIVDALFSFSQPLNTHYVWCPPMRNNQLDLRVLGLAD